jgi:hypothetical protein
MFRISCPFCGSDRIGVCRTTRYIYLPESLRSIKKNFAIIEESVEELRELILVLSFVISA